MLFPSEVFLFVFLPVVLGVYYLLLRKTKHLKNVFLLVASLFFYAWGEPEHVWLMVGVILFNWFFGILVDKVRDRKVPVRILMTLMVLTNVGILGWYKYSEFVMLQVNRFLHTEFTVPEVALPIGISFFTFQAMSYVIDVYRGHGKVQKNPLQVGLYISLFPQLIAGPIVRYETIAEQIENRVETLADFNAGVTRFCIGLGKKVLIANNMRSHIHCRYSLISVDILTWRLAWDKCLDSILKRTSTIHIFPELYQSSGEGGIFPYRHGSGIMCISHWAAAECQNPVWCLICSLSGH